MEAMRRAETWTKYRFPGPMLVIVAGAFLLRVFALDARPMHCDEAVHAYKAGILLETGRYEYNPREYHGPCSTIARCLSSGCGERALIPISPSPC
jgi:predicted membrane-bound mannosyltransferase